MDFRLPLSKHPEIIMSTNPFDAFGPQGYSRDMEEPARGFEMLPPGKYPVQIEKVEVRETRAGTGSYLWLEMNVFDGPQAGRKIWANLNLDNPNEKAVKIARKELSAILYAVELVNITHPDQLIGKWLYVSVRVKNDQNDVNGFYHPQDPVIVEYLQKQAAQPAPTQAAAYTPPAAAYTPPAAAYTPPVAAPAAPAAVAPPAQPAAPQQPAYPPQVAHPAAPPAQAPPVAAPPAAAPPAAAPPAAAPPAAAPAQQAPATGGKPPWA
jgi:hypothetical protein